ncbi:reticulon-4 isoform X1 [Lithobates pipiens]
MEDQSPNISSTYSAPEPDMDDILDLTGGQYIRRAVDEDDEEDRRSYSDSLEPSPESEEPSSDPIPPRGALPVIPSAPVEEEHDTPTSPYGPPPPTTTGSVDVNLFPLPASSAPLMQSSADNVMDLQQPSSTEPAGKEDLSSLLFESTTTLPSLSPLSADYPKEHTATIAFSADSTTPEALPRYSTETDHSEGKDYKYTFGLGGVEDVIFSERGYAVEHPTSQLESASVDQAKLYTQSAKEMFSGMLQSVGPPHEEFSDLKEAVDEHYADFKPIVSTVGYDFKDMALDFKSDVSHLNFESIKPEGKYIEEKDLDLSDISPASPDAISNSSSYETLAPLQKAAPLSYGGNPFTDIKSEKGVDGTETIPTSHLGSNVATVNPFLERIDKEAEYVTSSNESGIVGAQASSKAEGLTPDIVQEAYESEVYDLGIPKLNYEPKIDLVQTTAKASQEITPQTQNSSLFEDSNSVSSPVLPDIVMEAPLTSASQPDFSPAGHGLVSEEKIKFESEKPPSYEDATNKTSLKEQVTTVAHVEPVKGAQAVEAEAPYISIACDLIKETIPEKVTDFSKALKSEFDSQYTAHYDESSPESEPSEPSYKHWKAEVISKEEATSMDNVKSNDIFEKDQESDQEEEVVNKAYVETGSGSFETNLLAKEPVTQLSSQEKPLQMEAFGKKLYFEEVPPFKEPAHFEKPPKKEQESDQKWPEEDVNKAYAETASYGFDTNLMAKEPVKPLSSQEKPLQMEAFGKAVFSEGAPPAAETVHFEKPSAVSFVPEFSKPSKEDQVEVKKQDDLVLKDEPKKTEDSHSPQKAKESPPASDKLLDFSKGKSEIEDTISKPAPPTKGADVISSSTDKKQPPAPPALGACSFKTSVVDLLYWRDIKKSGLVFGASLFLLLSLTVFSIVSVSAYIALALLSVTISFRIYKGVLQAIQKSEEGHPFKSYLDSNVAVSEEIVNKYSNVALGHVNCTLKELRRLFLVEDLVDSLKFAVLMWVFTYIGALFNGLTLLILALISLFSIPVIYERHQTQVDHYIALISKNFNNVKDLILAKVPGLKRKAD